MRSIEFGGVCLDELCIAEVVDVSAASAVPSTIAVPGRPGALVMGADLAPRPIVVRLYLDAGYMPGSDRLAMIHRQVASALTSVVPTTLVLPSDLEYRNVLCVNAGVWESLYEDGSCLLQFVAYDPVGYGREVTLTVPTFEIGGSWPTTPRLELSVSDKTTLTLTEATAGPLIALENLNQFGTGSSVPIVIDCENETLTVAGEDARVCIALGSRFFELPVGPVSLNLGGATLRRIVYRERWA